MAGSSMTFTYDPGITGVKNIGHGDCLVVIASWVSDSAAGNVNTGNVTAKVVGRLAKVQCVPSNAAVPANNYNVTVTDSAGVDLSQNCETNLTNQSNTSTTETYLLIKNHAGTATSQLPLVCDTLILNVANAGNSTQGTIKLFIEPA